MGREYTFFNTIDEHNIPQGLERSRLRRLVATGTYKSKRDGLGPSVPSSEHASASTVQEKANLKSRFRLSEVQKEGNEKKKVARWKMNGRKRGRQEGVKQAKRLGPEAVNQLLGVSEGPRLPGESNMCNQRSIIVESVVEGKKIDRPPLSSLPMQNPSGGQFDPFNVLPVPNSPQVDTLLKLYKYGARKNMIAIIAQKNTWWSLISNDTGLMHATLATWALYGMLAWGMNHLYKEMLGHRIQAITELRKKDLSPRISDERIATTLTLASLGNLAGDYAEANCHIKGVKAMVDTRGGFRAFSHNSGLVRGLIWVDFHVAVTFRTPPSFPPICLDFDERSLPATFLEEATYNSSSSFFLLSLEPHQCVHIFRRLYRLALAASSRWSGKINLLALSNYLCHTEYVILSTPNHSSKFLDFDHTSKDEQNAKNLKRAHLADGARVVEALIAAAQIFIYAAIRDIPPAAQIFSILVDRLRCALDRPNISIIEIWKREKNVTPLLWVLTVALCVAPHWGTKSWWISKLLDVVKELGIHTQSDMEKRLEKVAWTDTFKKAVPLLWRQLGDYRSLTEICPN